MRSLAKTNLAKLFCSEHSAQDRWVCAKWNCDELPDVIDADLALPFSYLDS
jgi:hypothetical protein